MKTFLREKKNSIQAALYPNKKYKKMNTQGLSFDLDSSKIKAWAAQ